MKTKDSVDAVADWFRVPVIFLALANLIAVAQAATVTLEWDASADPAVTGYRLYRGTNSGTYDWSQTVGTTNATLVDGLESGQAYFFAVKSFNAAGIESLPSNEVRFEVPANRAPLALARLVTVAEDAAVEVILQGSDPDGDPLTFALVTPPAHGTLAGTPPNLTYTPAPNFNGPDAFTFLARDGSLDSPPATLALTVEPRNDAPVALARLVTVAEDAAVEVILQGSDPDGDPLTFALVTPPAHGTLTGTPPNLTYTPAPNFNGPDAFTFLARDGSLDSPPAIVTLTVEPRNDAPVAAAASLVATPGALLPIRLTATDVDGDPLTFTVTVPPLNGSLAGTPPNLSYRPKPGFTGSDAFAFVAHDGLVASPPATVTLSVPQTNRPPVAVSKVFNSLEDSPLPLVLNGSDPDGDALTFALITSPARGTLAGTPPNLTYTPAPNFNGTDSFRFTVSDGRLTSITRSIYLEIKPVNDAPVALAQALTVIRGRFLPLALAGADVDGDPLTFSLLGIPSHGILSGTISNLVYQPQPDFVGTDSISFATHDGQVASAPSTVQITVQDAESPLVVAAAKDGARSGKVDFLSSKRVTEPFRPESGPALLVAAGGTVDGLIGSAPESASGEAVLVEPPTHGTVTLNSQGAFTYVHNGAQDPADRFVLGITDPAAAGGFRLAGEVKILVLRLSAVGSGPQDCRLEFHAVANADYELQVNQDDSDPPAPDSPWETFTWGITHRSGPLSIPVGPELAHGRFRLAARQHGLILISQPVSVP